MYGHVSIDSIMCISLNAMAISSSLGCPTIPLLETRSAPDTSARWKVIKKMNMTTRYAFAGDYTGIDPQA